MASRSVGFAVLGLQIGGKKAHPWRDSRASTGCCAWCGRNLGWEGRLGQTGESWVLAGNYGFCTPPSQLPLPP